MAEHSEHEILDVTCEFLVRYAQDAEAGCALSLEDYQALYPGFEDTIAAEYRALTSNGHAVAEAASSEPRQLGPYRLLDKLGHGGQGLVYLAEDTRLHRRVALKVLNVPAPLSSSLRSRFQREVEAASRLDHPGICTVYEAGEVNDTPYFAMRYVDGETLAARLARERAQGIESSSGSGRSSGRHRVHAILAFFEVLADALQFAHEQGLVHRDVKPGNIMIEPSGQPVLLDFGLARAMESSGVSLTVSGDQLGTPAYMAPEQVAGRGEEVDRRTDVYALAVTLYEALTLRRPFDAESRESLYRQILGDDPQSPRALSHHVPRELEIVLQRALAKAPARRFPSAAAFGDELGRIRRHEPIRTRAPGPVLRLRRWTQRNPAAAVFFVLLTLGLAVSLGLLREINARERKASARALVGAAVKAVQDDPPLALRLALEAHETAPYLPETLSEVHRAVGELRQASREFKHDAPIVSLALSRDGRRALTASDDRTARLWDLEHGRPATVFGGEHGHEEGVYWAAFSPDESLVVTAGHDKRAVLWKATGEWMVDLPHPGPVWSAVFSPVAGESLVLTGCDDGFARLWSFEGKQLGAWQASRYRTRAVFAPADGDRILTYPDMWWTDTPTFRAHKARLWLRQGSSASLIAEMSHHKQVYSARFSPDGERVLTASFDKTAALWDGRDGRRLAVLHHDAIVFDGDFSPDGKYVLTCSGDYSARLWTPEGELLRELRRHGHYVFCGVFSPDPDVPWILTGSSDNTARVWDRAGRQIAVLRGHRGGEGIWRVAFVPSSDPPRLVTASQDGTMRVWELWDPELPVLMGHEAGILHADFSPTGELVATASDDWTIRLWGRRGHPAGVRVLRGHEDGVTSVRFSRAGDKLISGSYDGTARIWDVATGRELGRIQASGYVRSASFHLDSNSIVTAGHGQAQLWTRDGLALDAKLRYDAVRAVFSPDGSRILTAGRDGAARLYNLAGELIDVFEGHEGMLTSVAFDAFGTLVLTAGEDGKAILWDAEASPGERKRVVFEGPDLPVNSAEFAPDGERIVTAHSDGVARLWACDGVLLTELPGHRFAVMFATFSPRGDRILTCSLDGTARYWFVEKEDLLDHARQRSAR